MHIANGRSMGFRACLLALVLSSPAYSQLFDNLQSFGSRLDVGDPEVTSMWRGNEGPKGIATADLNGDGQPDFATSNLDGTVTIYLNEGEARFSPPVHLQTSTISLRGIIIADLNGDGDPDIATASNTEYALVLFFGDGSGGFSEAESLPMGFFCRNLTSGDFNGDGNVDLAVGGSGAGVVQYEGDGQGGFSLIAELDELDAGGWSKPVYTLISRPMADGSRDELFASHAWADKIWRLQANEDGVLEIVERTQLNLPAVQSQRRQIHSFKIAPLLQPASAERDDLVLVARDEGYVAVFSGSEGGGFGGEIQQRIDVPGGPRAIHIVDLDQDGWNDLVIVLRYFHRLITFRNVEGRFEGVTEMPVGLSPRDIAAADFSGDGQPDLAVINRISSDVSILTAYPGEVAFGAMDQYYLVDGEVAGLKVIDLNRDGRDDVLQLHRSSGDLSVRFASENGSMGMPTFYPMGQMPNDFRVADINGDDLVDVITSNMGPPGRNDGGIGVRLGIVGGLFGELKIFSASGLDRGRMFALEVADFDNDGLPDVAAGYFDCRVSFFKGMPDGNLVFQSAHLLVYEPRAMTTGDFDGDGDIDVAGASATGAFVVIENTGDLPSPVELTRHEYPPPSSSKFGTQGMEARDLNLDGDLDLLIASGDGVMVYEGREGIAFELSSAALPGTHFPASSVTIADFDGDGDQDVVAACMILSCIVILAQDGVGGDFLPVLSVDVPAGRFVASGDFDGDGFPDLVGSGEALWTALSSRAAEFSSPPEFEGERPRIRGLVINEIFAVNNNVPLASDEGRTPDWVEIYNGSDAPVELAGWTLARVDVADDGGDDGGDDRVQTFTFPESNLEAGGHLTVVFSRTERSPLHAGFRLPGDGAILLLSQADGTPIDVVNYPKQRENVSYARYEDAIPSFVFNEFPAANKPNKFSGSVAPEFSIYRVQPEFSDNGLRNPVFDEPLRIYAKGRDDVGIVTASLLLRVGSIDSEPQRVILYDDGLHQDGSTQDGIFSGVIYSGIPVGQDIFFQAEVVDLSDRVTLLPDLDDVDPREARPFIQMTALRWGEGKLQISEIVARNDTGLIDEDGGTPDWIAVRNCSGDPISLDGVHVGKKFPERELWFSFPGAMTLEPEQEILVFCDGESDQGQLHAPFNLKVGGDTLYLIDTTESGSLRILDAVDYPVMEPDIAYQRDLGQNCIGNWSMGLPTPPLGGTLRLGDVDGSGSLNITDPIGILGDLFLGNAMRCKGAADANSDEQVDLSDAVFLLLFLFDGGQAPNSQLVHCDP